MPMSQTEGESDEDFPGKNRSERSGSQSPSSTSPHNPAHSRNSIIQLSFPAKPMLEYSSWGHSGQEMATQLRRRVERRTWPMPVAVVAMCLSVVDRLHISCQTLLRLCSAHTLSILPPFPLHLSLFSLFLAGTVTVSDTVQLKGINI